ncbi:unnamed protein product [Paramecium pentaurelia]|uniref:Uncharacterized protein n=1 Tax=Paramecium pentaurelia TaxID=43138 RepID=A0A8S1VMQ3_9CILI|nr:unnamed protein product [Paramecium pentaurelia]
MSKAYLAVKNFKWSEMVNLLAYGVKHPDTLSQTQRITRLYRATIRRHYTSQLENFKGDHIRFYNEMQGAQKDFNRLQELNNNYANLNQEQKVEFSQLENKWVNWLESNYDAFLYVDECRPYSSTSTRYIVYTDEELKFDPLGFYKQRPVNDGKFDPHLPYFRDYPYNESWWNMNESFPSDFDDTPSQQH